MSTILDAEAMAVPSRWSASKKRKNMGGADRTIELVCSVGLMSVLIKRFLRGLRSILP